MSEQDQKEYIITLPAKVELDLTVKAKSFQEAVEKAFEITEKPWTIDNYEPDLSDVMWVEAEIAGVEECHCRSVPEDFREKIEELLSGSIEGNHRYNVVDIRPLQQFHSNKDEG